MDVELSYFHHSCLLHKAPTDDLWVRVEILQGERILLCTGASLSKPRQPHSLLHPGEVAWDEDGSFKLRTGQGSKWMLRAQHLKSVASVVLWISAGLWPDADSKFPDKDFPWLAFMGENKLLGLCDGVMGPCSWAWFWISCLKTHVVCEHHLKRAAQHLVRFVKKWNNLEALIHKPCVLLSWGALYVVW